MAASRSRTFLVGTPEAGGEKRDAIVTATATALCYKTTGFDQYQKRGSRPRILNTSGHLHGVFLRILCAGSKPGVPATNLAENASRSHTGAARRPRSDGPTYTEHGGCLRRAGAAIRQSLDRYHSRFGEAERVEDKEGWMPRLVPSKRRTP
jgi:hypothetical protein